MKCVLSIQEKLKDLRIEKGLSLEELALETGISKSALGSYESKDYKDISHTAIIKLAKYYGVSTDYLLGITENIEDRCSDLADLKLDDETVEILRSKKFNNRLLCEIIKHPGFQKFMSDTEIYVDSLASMQIKNLNSFVAIMRSKIQLQNNVSDSDLYIKTLRQCEINEDDYFSRLIGEDMKDIARDIRDTHHKDKDTADDYNPLTEVLDVVNGYASAPDPMKATLTTLSRQLGMNFTKMDAAEVQFFTTLVEKYSNVYKAMVHKKGRGKR